MMSYKIKNDFLFELKLEYLKIYAKNLNFYAIK